MFSVGRATQFGKKTLNDEDNEGINEDLNEENLDGEDCDKSNLENGILDDLDESEDEDTGKRKKKREEKYKIKFMTKGVLLTILYIALNLDKSDIQLSHLFRFIREGRLSLYNCTKFVPKELSVKSIPNWVNFNHSRREYTTRSIRFWAMTMFKQLNLGVPIVPDLNKIIDAYIKELCLPKDFKDLVLSLINLMPCDYLQMDDLSKKKISSTPDYETACMTYILIALKICFGLDCDYEIKLSDAVDKINSEEDFLKSYKLGIYSEATDRLFSFREWSMFLQFRKMIVCKYYLPMARQYKIAPDDSVYMEQLEERKKRKIKLSDDVTMDILNKIPLEEPRVIPKKEFPVTLTPMSTYTEVILEYIHEPNLKLLLCEDFTQYSLKYATTDLNFPKYIDSNYLIRGVNESNKVINSNIIGTFTPKQGDPTLVLVRNCDNKHWLKTKPPTSKHITKIKNDKSDFCYDSRSELSESDERSSISSGDEDLTKHEDCTKDEDVCDVIEEEDEELCIFDDDFKNLHIEDDNKKNLTQFEESFDFNINNLYDSKSDINEAPSVPQLVFNPETFDREKTIKELLEIACKKYRIPRPKELQQDELQHRKRKNFVNTEPGVSEPKRKRNTFKRGEAARITQELIDAYYENINNDILLKVSEQVKSVIETTENRGDNQEEFNDTDTMLNSQTEDIDHQNDNNTLIDNASVGDGSILKANGTVDEDDGDDEGNKDIEELLPKTNPDFDPKTHDIQQLYVKLKQELDGQDILNFDINDPDIDILLNKKIAQYQDLGNDGDGKLSKIDNKKAENDADESDDDVPLSVFLEQKLSYLKKKDKSNFDYLVKERKIGQFSYWMRHYTSRVFTASSSMTQKFDNELAENCPKSFVFVLNECAAIAECTPFQLYRYLQKLEEWLASKVRIEGKFSKC